jgi:hypothetical protein
MVDGDAVDTSNVTDDETLTESTIDTSNAADAAIDRLEALLGSSTPEEREYGALRAKSTKGTHCLDCGHEYEADEPIVIGKVEMPPYPWSGQIRYWQVTRCQNCVDLTGCTPYSCETCGRDVYKRNRWRSLHIFCSALCSSRHYNALQREKRLKNRQKQCAQCGAGFTGTRSDSKFCSAACKQKDYRQRIAGTGK